MHLRADRLIRIAHERVQDQGALEGYEEIVAGLTAARAWHQFIYREQATGTALEYVQNLSPWGFCQFLGELVVADPATNHEQDRYFCDLATGIDSAARPAAFATTTSVEPKSEPGRTVAPDAYDKALAKAAMVGVRNADNASLMAGFCDGALQLAVGAVSPRLVWEGAQRRGMTAKELCRLAGKDPLAVAGLMW
ncbi:hypothetical protein ACIBBB_34795 [Streptomyces sp. NPDC051217]|uniref:hypothetical protein n=1 Tax=Streptomyces sp. NPDC051217 TaxID=3365644 RepID=UPI0037BCDB3A